VAVRRETIILELEDNASREALQAAAAFKVLDSSLGKLSGSATKTRGLQNTRRDVEALGKSMDRTGASIDTFSGRLGLLGTAAMALGPALIPVGAVAIPAIATLTAGMGAAAGAAGVMLLAFQGVGEAVTAVSEYRLSPTADNLAKVREEMEKLGPAGAAFVMAIDRAMPAFRDLQMTAREGMFPGLEQGLDTLVTQLPGVRDLVAGLSETVGELGAASADALVNDSDWQEFFAHIGTDGASALEDFGRATGNFVAGVANLLEAMTGIGSGSGGMLETSRAFREWADNLEHTEGFKEFANYVRESGPQVAEFLAAAGKAMVGLIEAAAPWGQVVLPALTALAEVTAAIAGSPLGPPLFAAAAGMLALSKASSLLGPGLGRMNTGLATTRTSLSGFGRDIGLMSREFSNLSRTQSTALSFFSGTSSAAKRARASLAEVGRTAAAVGPGIAAFGALSTGAADKMNLTNTATLTLAGSMAGPWGAAVGAGAGLLMDFSKANNDAQKAVDDLTQAINSGADFDVLNKKLEEAEQKVADYKKSLEFEGLANGGSWGEFWDQFWGNSKEPFSNQAEKNADALKKSRAEIEKLGKQQVIDDSLVGRTEAFGDALADLGEDAISTAKSAAQLNAALDALLAPNLDLSAAQDAMSSTLNNLKDEIDATNKSLVGSSEAAITNREAIRGGVTDINELTAAQAAAGKSSLTVAETMNAQRLALIDAGVAAGLSRSEVEAYVNELGLTPDVVRTAFEAAGIDGVTAKTQRLVGQFLALPPKVQTNIQANGIPTTMGQVDALVKKYGLTEKERRALISLKDNATPGLNNIIGTIGRVKGKTVKVDVDTGGAISNVRAVQAVINSLQGKTVTVTTLQRTIYAAGKMDSIAKAQGKADGGEVLGQRFPYGDKVLVALAPGEEVITNRNGQADRFRRDRELGLIPAYAQGGTIGDYPGYAKGGKVRGVKAGGERDRDIAKMWDRAAKTTARALKDHGKQLDRATDRLDYWNDKRKDLKSQVVGSLTRNWMGDGSTNIWGAGAVEGTAAYAQQQWAQQIKDSKALSGNIANLRKNGAGDAFLAEILRSEDPLAAARMFNKQSVGGMRHSQKLFLEASRRAQGAGTFGANVVFGDEIAKTTREVRGVRKDIKSLTKLQQLQHKQAQDSRKKNGAGKATSSGSRARTRSKRG
jgi:hypothetical protein